jgi:endonuclease/exonuclease/phosphatase family metal-dependent hydrolase
MIKKHISSALVLILTVFQVGCTHLWADKPSLENDTVSQVRVMSWNLLRDQWAKPGQPKWAERAPSAIQILRKHLPDVVGLQEETTNQLSFITSELPNYSYVKPHHKNGGGLLIRSKAWHVIKSGKISIPRGRQASWALLKSTRNNQRWLFYNAHFMHRSAANSAEHRMEAAKRIAAHMTEHAPNGIPVVMTGDFNTLHDQPSMRYLGGDAGSPVKFSNAFNRIHGTDDPRGTFRGLSSEHHCDRIDHILINEHVSVLNTEIIYYDKIPGAYPSDHYPVQSILSISSQDDVQESHKVIE